MNFQKNPKIGAVGNSARWGQESMYWRPPRCRNQAFIRNNFRETRFLARATRGKT